MFNFLRRRKEAQEKMEAMYSRGLAIPAPARKTPGAAGYDLSIASIPEHQGEMRVVIGPQERLLVNTGVKIHIKDPAMVGMITIRSGVAAQGLTLVNGVGVIDSDYQGEIKMYLFNTSKFNVTVSLGDRIAQLLVVRIATPELVPVEGFTITTERNSKGFGSTGT